MDVNIKTTAEGRKLEKLINEYKKKSVVIGYQRGEKTYLIEDSKTGEEVDLLDVVLFNEYGTSKIPSRPFMRNSVDKYEDTIKEFVTAQVKSALDQGTEPEEVLKRFGAFHVGLIQKSILDGEYAPNAPYTIKKKGSSKPLVDTGQMLQSPHYIIREEGD